LDSGTATWHDNEGVVAFERRDWGNVDGVVDHSDFNANVAAFLYAIEIRVGRGRELEVRTPTMATRLMLFHDMKDFWGWF
jgi:hypothetical protein